MTKTTPVREKQLQNIYDIVSRAGASGMSIADVARAMPKRKVKGVEVEMKVTPYLRDMLDQLVDEFHVLRKEQSIISTERGDRMGWMYFVVPESQ